MLGCYASRGFLPCKDPATELQQLGEGQHLLDRVGHALPSLLLEADARQFLERLTVPEWPYANIPPDLLPQARLYYLRLGFIVSGYVNQVGQPPVHRVPVNLA
ncbi:hypothetical protein ACFVYJ_13730, partial [Pontibacter sp. JAM-7]|uniref:hypothetical protein n=1 Tax=Pontibacter sp. JAM-7 TaxID=3366581 RepID=UPI003AF623F0